MTAATDEGSTRWADIGAIAICTLVWGTTWYAITLQFGRVDPVISVIYRFTLAAGLLFAWCFIRRESVTLTRAQHATAICMGLCTFAANYVLVYWAEERVTSAVVAVTFAAMAFINLISFRVAFGERAPALSWLAAGLGVLGVAALSYEEVLSADMNTRAVAGIALTLAAVVAASLGNVFAKKGESASVPALTAWSMSYGVAGLVIFALASGKAWTFDARLPYVLSLLHLAINGSVIAFLAYFGLARRRGYATAAYTSALTPPVAMLVSTLFEGRSWGLSALAGIAIVLAGQVAMLRVKRA